MNELENWKALVREDINQAASDFCALPDDHAARIGLALGVPCLTDVVLRLGTDDSAEILRKLSEDLRRRILEGMPADRVKAVREVLSYRPGTAGALMAKEFLSVPADATIGRATDYLRGVPTHLKGKVSYIYVVDGQRRLEGVIQIRDLVFHPPDKRVREILKSPVVQVETGMTQIDVARLLQRHRYLGLPVVDAQQRLVGVVSADTAMQVLERKASDDIAKIVGTGAEEISTHSVKRILRLRLPWLFVSLISGLSCAFILGFFENDLEAVATLFLFVPLVLGLSESAGVQGATIVVRNLSLGRVSFSQLSRLFTREVFAGVWIGIVCGLAVGSVAYLWKGDTRIGAALAGSMTLAVIFSALIGICLPLLFKRFRIDPAIASGPLVLALCDIQTLMIYFNLSGLILKSS